MPSERSNGAQDPSESHEVVIVGGGVSGLSAAIFTARAELDTLVLNHGGSIVLRNAHLENYPGFPAGVNPRLLIEMMEEQAERSGARLADAKITHVSEQGDNFQLATAGGDTYQAENVIAASWSDVDYLKDFDLELRDTGSKQFLQPDGAGRTGIDGLYAAGRLADQYHQTIVSAGHGAQVAITLIEDVDPEFYHDWVAPEGYFTLRDREVPKGCEEISKAERNDREKKSIEVMQAYFAEPWTPSPVPHPSLEDEDAYDP